MTLRMLPLIAYVITPILFGLMCYIVPNRYTKTAATVLQVLLFMATLHAFSQLGTKNEIIQLLSKHRLPAGMSLRLDYLSAVMLLLSNFLFMSMVIFSRHKGYMNKLFIFLFLSLHGIINGIFLSNDLFNVYILVEVATVIVSILIMFKKDAMSMYDGMIYLLVNMVAMAFFLFGIAYVYKYFGLFDFIGIQNLMPLVTNPKPLFLPFTFLLTAVSLKAAVMPLFSWLPKAHGTASAPSIVSAILSGIFVKTGVYLLIRITVLFDIALDVSPLLLWTGYGTAIAGFVFAIAQTDIKAILAYHTISQVGLMMIGLHSDTPFGYQGGVYHVINHGIFKSLLFIIAGVMIEIYHTRNISQMKGMWWRSRWLSVALIVAVLSITGAPFFSGGFSKTMIAYGASAGLHANLLVFIGLGTMTSFVKFILAIFKRENQDHARFILPANQKIGLGLLMVACFVLGAFGEPINLYLMGNRFSLSWSYQMSKLFTYGAQYAFALLVYKIWLSKSPILRYLRRLELTFNSIMLALASFFAGTLAYLNLFLA
jgi:multicomponent Na+:H+ antiporter subunit D